MCHISLHNPVSHTLFHRFSQSTITPPSPPLSIHLFHTLSSSYNSLKPPTYPWAFTSPHSYPLSSPLILSTLLPPPFYPLVLLSFSGGSSGLSASAGDISPIPSSTPTGKLLPGVANNDSNSAKFSAISSSNSNSNSNSSSNNGRNPSGTLGGGGLGVGAGIGIGDDMGSFRDTGGSSSIPSR